jgi:hypothetical protein
MCNEMVNAATVLIPLLCITAANGFYLNTATLVFVIVASTNHVMPANLDGLTHMVKMLFTNVLAACIGIPAWIAVPLSCLDLMPWFTANERMKFFGELFLQAPRQVVDLYLVAEIYRQGYVWSAVTILVCKVVYYLERR